MFKANSSAENIQINQKRAMDRRIKQALKFMDENLGKKLTLKALSWTFSLSSVYFSGLFRKEIGVCFSKYILQLRINKAKVLLKETSLSVKEVSYAVGYRCVSNFDHDFKRLVGLSPLEYRKRT
jgi:two-component system response regulator YesN